ncbi:hypothetical protein [Intrasporangium oryzae]|uniref:hypothetical protein n=1 Tax=Intrasporangium oryzae TaxID=412687 RepID=UPI0012FC7B42|nr:hypothetical protein [Intrasporangium oryzae]
MAVRVGFVAAAAAVPLALMSPASAGAVTTTTGAWGFYPSQTYSDSTSTASGGVVYKTAVRAPINADNTSTFSAKRGVIPVQFDLLSATGTTVTTTRNYDPPVWESIWSNNVAGDASTNKDDYSTAVFTPTSSLTFNDITNLSATYSFTQGDCYGGSLRWTINVTHFDPVLQKNVSQNVYVYYGDPGGVQSCTGAASGSGQNLITTGATNRFEIAGSGAPVYTTKDAVTPVVGTDHVNWVGLALDSGWSSDQKADVSDVTVNDNLYVRKTSEVISTVTTPGEFAKTCDLPAATLQWAKDDGTAAAVVNEALSIQPKDTNGVFRQVDCKYIYNLDVSTLPGTGTYRVYANIAGVNVSDPAQFDLK